MYKEVEGLVQSEAVEVDFKGVLNSVTKIRHNIIHQDATPNLTHLQIAEYTGMFRNFVSKLDEYLSGFENVFREVCISYEAI